MVRKLGREPKSLKTTALDYNERDAKKNVKIAREKEKLP